MSIRGWYNRIPEEEIRPITRAYDLGHVHSRVNAWAKGYSSDSSLEVDLENNDREYREGDEMPMFLRLV